MVERRELDRALEEVRGGHSAVLVVRGEAGIGKTALMHYCARQSAGCRVVRITGVESELELPFAAVHQLCRPMLSDLSALPGPQAGALRVAFGLEAGSVPDRFVVGLAVLSLLAQAASERPLVVLVDDAQWLDEPSAQVLGFVARRLLAEPVLLLFAVREVDEERLFPDLPALALEGLGDEDAKSLLRAAVTGPLDELVRDRIVAETRGNPLALLEFPRAMSPSELAGGFAVLTSSTLTGQLHSRYLRRVRALPEPAQRLMLLAAADPTGDATLLWRAAKSLDVGREAAAAAELANLLRIGARVQFRHPLVRSAAYAAGSLQQQRAAHRALADATDVRTDPERRVWHRAAAATGSDEEVAAELVRTASIAQARAGLAAAAAFLQRSVDLTSAAAPKAERALRAAAASLHAGALDAARSLVAEASAAAVDDLQRARVEQLAGQIEAAARPASEAPGRLILAARRLESLDVRMARDTYLSAWWPALLAGSFAAPGGTLEDVCRAAQSAPRPATVQPSDMLLDALVTVVMQSRAAAAPLLRAALELFLADQVSEDDWIQWGRGATSAAILLWDMESYRDLSSRQVTRVRESGALSPLALALNAHTYVLTLCGELEAASVLVAEQYAVKEVTGIQFASYGVQVLAAYRGRPSELAAVDVEIVGGADGLAVDFANLARATLNSGLGQYARAFEAARRVSTFSLAPFALPEVIEAAVRTQQPDEARKRFAQLSKAVVPGSDWSDGIEARCRALLCSGEEAERSYAESIACLSRTLLRLDLARAHLLYGEWLRRELRRVDARHQLRTAYELFTAAGAQAFAERARSELLATGEKIRKRQVDMGHELTPQEQHIARLARDGRTNPEIGAELFLSPRTVEWHLRKVFTKLEISSRRGLHEAFPPASGDS